MHPVRRLIRRPGIPSRPIAVRLLASVQERSREPRVAQAETFPGGRLALAMTGAVTAALDPCGGTVGLA